MSSVKITFFRSAIVFIAPVVMLAAFIFHPHIGNPGDEDFLTKLAAAVTADPTLWAAVHYMTAIGIGLMILAFIALRSFLQEAGEERWSLAGLPFVVLGNMFYAMLPSFEFAPYAAVQAGYDAELIQAALMPWFAPTLLISALFFTIGVTSFAVGVWQCEIFSGNLKWLVPGALIVMAASRFVLLMNVVQFYVQGFAGIVALFPLAYVMWKYTDAKSEVKVKAIPAS